MSEKDIREFYENAVDLIPQTLINYLVKEVILYDDKVIVKFNSPLRTSPDDSQGFSLCDKETVIPVYIQNSLETKLKTIRLRIAI